MEVDIRQVINDIIIILCNVCYTVGVLSNGIHIIYEYIIVYYSWLRDFFTNININNLLSMLFNTYNGCN